MPVAGVNGLIPPFSLLNILRTATGLTDDTKNYADQLIDDAKKSMLNLGDAVYVGRAGDKIAEIHNGLMDKLQALPVDGLSEFSSAVGAYAKTDAVIKPLTSMFQKVLVEQACANDNCRKVDEEYFVGSYAKDRDFMIPKTRRRNICRRCGKWFISMMSIMKMSAKRLTAALPVKVSSTAGPKCPKSGNAS